MIDGNTSSNVGGGIFNDVGAGPTGGSLAVINSTLSNNSANSTALAFGGAIYNGGLTLGSRPVAYIINSTLSGNSATAPNSKGGGVYNAGSALGLGITSSTIANNTANEGGGLYQSGAPTGSMRSSIVALNTALITSPSILTEKFGSSGHNVIGTTAAATIAPNTGDQFGVTREELNLGSLESQTRDNQNACVVTS